MNAFARSVRLLGCGLFLLSAACLRGQTGLEAWFAPREEVTNAVSLRYKCRVAQNQSPVIMIIFGASRFYGASNETYLLENNLYADGLSFTNGICTTWPLVGTELWTRSSLRSAIPDYNEHGWTGAQPLSPAMFPKQTYEIDGISNLWKMDTVCQTNLNGTECDVQLTRAGIITDLTGWNCSGLLDTNVIFREWDSMITFDGATYTNRFALPDANGRYVTSYEMFDFYSEFFWLTNQFQAFFWNLELQREGETWWRRVNQFNVYRQDAYPTNYGARVVSDQGTNVIEISNVGGLPAYLNTNTQFDLSVSLDGVAPDLAPVSLTAPAAAFAGQTIQVILVITNRTAISAGGFSTGYFLSADSDVALKDLFTGTATQAAGLAGFGTVTLTNLVTIPSAVAAGSYFLGALVDYQGLLVETVKTNNTLAVPVTVLGCLPSPGAVVTNSWYMPAGFKLEGWVFQQLPDTRPGGAASGSNSAATSLTFAGDLSLMSGTLTNQGPAYTATTFYPYIQLDTNHQWLILHPGDTSGAALGVAACRSGTYHFSGAFARANDAQFAGNGVVVAVVRNLDTTNFLFTANIPSSAAADPSNLFQGPGAAPFHLDVTLTRGELIRFVVFNGPPGVDDIGFDATALMFNASLDPAPPIVLRASLRGSNVQIDWAGLPEQTYEVLSATNLAAWAPVSQVTSTCTNHLFSLYPATNRMQAFRVRLVP
ncbi:MAG TPA: CARDB domain-containing protein [Candidatus Binatia bacterium]|jgi:hypothetical protein|nr:CARDB domain-containing protein [Candidatus Binatia bacterium]